MKTILITGSSGFVGQYLCNEFKKNYFVIGADIDDYSKKLVNLFYEVDMLDSEALEKIFIDNEVDYVIHTAANKSIVWCEENESLARKINQKSFEEGVDKNLRACRMSHIGLRNMR